MSTADTLLDNIRHFWQTHDLARPAHVVVGVSGGADSLVLLHALRQLADELALSLHVATLDHGLRGAAGAEDAAFVENLAQEWGLPVTRSQVDVAEMAGTPGYNVEEVARQARYTFLLEVAAQQNAPYIATAHHRDDQAETVLMHVIRGTGLRGLRGMLPITPLSDYHLLDEALDETQLPEDYLLLRPLLETPQSLILDYARQHDLQPRYDATNEDLTRFRNTLRHEVLPQLATLNPNIKETLTRLAAVAQAEVDVLDSHLASVAAWLLEWDETQPSPEMPDGGEVVYIDRLAFAEQRVGMQRGLVRKAVFDLAPDLRDFSFEQTEAVRDLLLHGETGAQRDLPGGLQFFVGYDEAMIGTGGVPRYPAHLPALSHDQYVPLDLDGQGYISGKQRLVAYWVVEGLSRDLYPTDPLECTLAITEDARLTLRTRQPGDRFRPFGLDGHSQKLSDTFTNLKVPVYYRDQVPLLIVNDEIAWFVAPTANGPVGRIAEPFAVRPDSPSVLRVRWEIETEQTPVED